MKERECIDWAEKCWESASVGERKDEKVSMLRCSGGLCRQTKTFSERQGREGSNIY